MGPILSATPGNFDGVSTMFGTAIDGAGPELLAVAGVAVGIGALVLVARRGWALIKGFTK